MSRDRGRRRARSACGDGSTSSSRTTRPSAFETAFWATTSTSASSKPPARSAASSEQRGEVVALLDLRDALERDHPDARRSREAGDPDARVRLVALVDVHDHRGHPLERAGAGERARSRPPGRRRAARRARARAPSPARRRRRRARPRRAAPRRGSPRRASAGRRRPGASSSSSIRSAIDVGARGRLDAAGAEARARRTTESTGVDADRLAQLARGVDARHPRSRRGRRGRRRGRRRRCSPRRRRAPRPSARARSASREPITTSIAGVDEPLRDAPGRSCRCRRRPRPSCGRPERRLGEAARRRARSVISVCVTTRRTAVRPGWDRTRRRRARRSGPRSSPRRAPVSCRPPAARAYGLPGP